MTQGLSAENMVVWGGSFKGRESNVLKKLCLFQFVAYYQSFCVEGEWRAKNENSPIFEDSNYRKSQHFCPKFLVFDLKKSFFCPYKWQTLPSFAWLLLTWQDVFGNAMPCTETAVRDNKHLHLADYIFKVHRRSKIQGRPTLLMNKL